MAGVEWGEFDSSDSWQGSASGFFKFGNRYPSSIQSKEFFFYHGWLLVGQDLLIVKSSRSHSDTPHSVVLPWTRQRPVTETFTCQHTRQSQETDIHTTGGIRTHNPSKRSVADPRLRPRRQRNRQKCRMSSINIRFCCRRIAHSAVT